jgi:hypothetical protein
MKYLLVAALGLLIGAAAAGAAIYYNPFTMTKSAHLDVADRALHYSLPSEVLGFALGDAIMPPGTPKRDGSLWEETIDRTAMLSLVLDDAHDNPTAIASRLLAVSPRTDFVLSGVRVNDYWLLTIPGEGTLFLRAETNVWPFLKETLPVWYLGRPWKGPSEYSPTARPSCSAPPAASWVSRAARSRNIGSPISIPRHAAPPPPASSTCGSARPKSRRANSVASGARSLARRRGNGSQINPTSTDPCADRGARPRRS